MIWWRNQTPSMLPFWTKTSQKRGVKPFMQTFTMTRFSQVYRTSQNKIRILCFTCVNDRGAREPQQINMVSPATEFMVLFKKFVRIRFEILDGQYVKPKSTRKKSVSSQYMSLHNTKPCFLQILFPIRIF